MSSLFGNKKSKYQTWDEYSNEHSEDADSFEALPEEELDASDFDEPDFDAEETEVSDFDAEDYDGDLDAPDPDDSLDDLDFEDLDIEDLDAPEETPAENETDMDEYAEEAAPEPVVNSDILEDEELEASPEFGQTMVMKPAEVDDATISIGDTVDLSEYTFDDEKKSVLESGVLIRIAIGVGVAIAICAIAFLVLYKVKNSVTEPQKVDFTKVGISLEGTEIIGEDGLSNVKNMLFEKKAVADAEAEEAARLELERLEQEKNQQEYEEKDLTNQVNVTLQVSSVYQDIKLKFTNKSTGKLIAGVPFEVSVTTPSGKTENWTDDDKDGIIYKSDLKSGKYKFEVNELGGDAYKKYSMPAGTKTADAKSEIAYEKVDVKNEVKDESQINVQKEDTKQNIQSESSLTDTVPFVESTQTAGTYVEINKSEISDPAKITTVVVRMNRLEEGDGAEQTPAPAEEPTPEPTETPAETTAPTEVPAETGAPTEVPTATPVPTAEPTPTPLPELGKINLKVSEITLFSENEQIIEPELTGFIKPIISASSADTNVATVEVIGGKIKIVAKSAESSGVTSNNPKTATITVTVSETDYPSLVTSPVSLTVTVKIHPKEDRITKLQNEKQQQVYILKGDEYVEATYADYYTEGQHFFVKGDIKYTGWQQIDGKTYFFSATGNKVTGEQVIQGAKYNFDAEGVLQINGVLGIDVSKWQGSIDWNAVKNSGVNYAIIRCGYRGSSAGSLIEDSTFKKNIKGATDAGIKVGIYFYSQAINQVEAIEEASMVLNSISGYKIAYPIFIDVEASGGRGDKIDSDTRTAVCLAFCKTIQNAGYTAGIYSNKNWFESKLDMAQLGAYKIWLAQYATVPNYQGKYDIWQYSEKGTVSGIDGTVDMNLSYLNY